MTNQDRFAALTSLFAGMTTMDLKDVAANADLSPVGRAAAEAELARR